MTRIHIDCETTGLNPGLDILLEVSWYNENDGVVYTVYNPAFADRNFRSGVARELRATGAGEINKYFDLYGGSLENIPITDPDFFRDALHSLSMLQKEGATFIGFNVAFDIGFLSDYDEFTTHRTLDLTSFFTGVLYAPRDYRQIAPLGFRDVIARVKPEFREHIPSPDHTSAGDVAATVALMRMYSTHGLSLFIPVWDIPRTEMP